MNDSVLTLRGRLIASHQIVVQSLSVERFAEQLEKTLAKAPTLFKSAPCVLDLTSLGETVTSEHMQPIIEVCQKLALVPFAITGDKELHQGISSELDLAWVDYKAGTTQQQTVTSLDTHVISAPVRSGQQIYAANANLLITSQVSAGAEIAADGNIHVLGPLRGRAIAGATGNAQAEIVCQDMHAELISIAGIYTVQDDFPEGSGSARCHLDGDKLLIEYL